MKIILADFTHRVVQMAFDTVARELDKVRMRGDMVWWKPKYLCAPDAFPRTPKGNAWCWDDKTKREYFYHEGEGRWYQSGAYTVSD